MQNQISGQGSSALSVGGMSHGGMHSIMSFGNMSLNMGMQGPPQTRGGMNQGFPSMANFRTGGMQGSTSQPQFGALMGGQSAALNNANSSSSIENPTLPILQMNHQNFGRWMIWCQACKHGGHANHITEWFSKNSVCPVTECRCKCSSL